MKSRSVSNNYKMIKSIINHIPLYFTMTIISGIVWGGVNSVVTVYFVKVLFDAISSGVQYSSILKLTGALALFLIVSYIFSAWFTEVLKPKEKQKLHLKMQSTLLEKANNLDISCYSDPVFYNDFVLAMGQADDRVFAILGDIENTIHGIVAVSTVLGILFTIDISIVIIMIATIIVSYFIGLKISKYNLKCEEERSPLERERQYVDRVLYLKEYAQEIRMSKVKNLLFKKYDNITNQIKKTIKKWNVKILKLDTVNQLCTTIIFDFAIIGIVLVKVLVSQTISLGDFAATVGIGWKLFAQFNRLISIISKFKEHGLFAQKYLGFLEYSPAITSIENRSISSFEKIEIRGLTFSYPHTDKVMLKNINLSIKAFEKVAFVGYNGAGKSTLLNLLLRLYDLDSGEILLNGVNIKAYNILQYRTQFTAVFQDYRLFGTTIAENVLMDFYDNDRQGEVLDSIKKSGFDKKLNELSLKENTQLTKEFDDSGVELSGGQAQKIAIARIFASHAPIAVLDEPSSALDVDTDYQFSNLIMSHDFMKTVIIVTHRLSTASLADTIYMFDEGTIVETGSHDTLMKLNGKYANMFKAQAEKYRN